jgi:hypothetical protein
MSKSYTPIQAFEAKQLSVDLLDKPQDFYMHHRRYAGSVIMQINSIRPTNSRIELTIGDVKMFGTYSVSYHALHHTGDRGNSGRHVPRIGRISFVQLLFVVASEGPGNV